MLLLFALLAAGFAQQPAPDEKDWKAFLTSLSNQPATSNPEDLLAPYRAVLIQRGLSPQEAERLAGQLRIP